MKIDEIAKKMTREEFLDSIVCTERGSLVELLGERDKCSCPSDYGLKEYCYKGAHCKNDCWLKAIENIKFKGEEDMKDRYECIEDFFMSDGAKAFSKGKAYEVVNSTGECVAFDINDMGVKSHWMNEKSIEKHFKKVEQPQTNSTLFKEFLDGKLAVNCQTEEESKELLKHCKKNNLEWSDGSEIELDDAYWNYYKSETCCSLKPKLQYSPKNFFESQGYEIITYKQLITPAEKEEEKESTRTEEEKTYKGWEILKMIDEGVLKEGDIIIWHNGSNEIQEEFKICPTKNLWFIRLNKEAHISYFIYNIAQSYFTIKEKEYMTFDEARKSEKRFKHKDMKNFNYNLCTILNELSKLSPAKAERMLDEKAWEVEN